MDRLSVRQAALAGGTFLAITYVLCVAWDLAVPADWHAWQMYPAWQRFLPGFVWLTPGSFVLGLAETFFFGLYAGGLLAFLYNAFSTKS